MQHNIIHTGTHQHTFHISNPAAEKGTMWVMWITALMMVVEIVAGWWYNSMALLADGWHMSSHTLAIGLSAFAYIQARKYANDQRFAFGTWKIEVLSGFASALFLVGVAAMMIYGSVDRLLSPEPIHYEEAIFVAIIGLVVNFVCALILGSAHDHHGHGHGHGHAHGHNHSSTNEHGHEHENSHSHSPSIEGHTPGHVHHDHGPHSHHKSRSSKEHTSKKHHDLNLRSAYIHVIADAATSVLAIVALFGGMIYGWSWLDPVMGIVGAVLVGVWAKNLIVDTSKVLLDREMDDPIVEIVKSTLQNVPLSTVTDLHIWRVGSRAYACTITLSTQDPTLRPLHIKERLQVLRDIAHATVEINH